MMRSSDSWPNSSMLVVSCGPLLMLVLLCTAMAPIAAAAEAPCTAGPFAQARPPQTDGERQRATVSMMEAIGAALVERTIYGDPRGPEDGPPEVDLTLYDSIPPADLEAALVPEYLPCLPLHDAWGHPFDFYLTTSPPYSDPGLLALRSPGADGAFNGTTYTIGAFSAESVDEDLVWADGFWVRQPE